MQKSIIRHIPLTLNLIIALNSHHFQDSFRFREEQLGDPWHVEAHVVSLSYTFLTYLFCKFTVECVQTFLIMTKYGWNIQFYNISLYDSATNYGSYHNPNQS